MLSRDPSNVSEVANDISGHLMNFWSVLKDPLRFSMFQRIIEATPFSESEWQDSSFTDGDMVDRAVRFFISSRMSMAGRGDSFAPLTRNRIRRGMNEQARAWRNVVWAFGSSCEVKVCCDSNCRAVDAISEQEEEDEK